MALDPYLELRVQRGASAAEIKRAYRRRIAEVHPDKNPDDPFASAKAQQVQEAYEILSDAARRKAYDTNGETQRPANLDVSAHSMLTQVFLEVLSGGAGDHVVARMHTALKVIVQKNKATVREGEAINKRIAAVKLRFRCRNGENFLAAILDNQVEKNRVTIDGATRAIAVAARASEMLSAFEDVEQQLLGGTSTSTTTFVLA